MPITQPAPAAPGNQAPQPPSVRRPLPANVPQLPRPINIGQAAALPRWAINALLFALFGIAPLVAHLLDGPSEIDAARATAATTVDAIAQAQRVARLGDAP